MPANPFRPSQLVNLGGQCRLHDAGNPSQVSPGQAGQRMGLQRHQARASVFLIAQCALTGYAAELAGE